MTRNRRRAMGTSRLLRLLLLALVLYLGAGAIVAVGSERLAAAAQPADPSGSAALRQSAPDGPTILLPLVLHHHDRMTPPASPIATPTPPSGRIDGCAPDRRQACEYTPAVWREAASVRVLTGHTVYNTADDRTLPVLVRYAADAPPGQPMGVWSHGGSARDQIRRSTNEEWGTVLARAGYVVVHPAHVSPDRAALCRKLGVIDPEACLAFNAMTWFRPSDARAVLDALPEIAAAFPELAGRADTARVAYAGHSFGAFTSMTVAGARVDYVAEHTDVSWAHPLPRAFVAMSPQGPGRFGFHDGSWRDIERPVLTGSGAGDALAEEPPDRREPYRRMPPGDKYELWIESADAVHGTFGLNPRASGGRFQRTVAMSAVAFLDAYVRDRPEARAWLASENPSLLGGDDVFWQRK